MVTRGSIDFELRPARGRERPRPGEESAMRILVVGDFSAGTRRATEEHRDPAKRRPVAVDVDSFERVMARLAPPEFGTLDDFHPDTLYRQRPAFRKLRESRLAATDAGDFARLLGGTPPAGAPEIDKSGAAAGYVQALIREAVAPHIVPDAPPHQALYAAAADAAVGDAMRAVLQDPAFKHLEAQWRGLWWLVSGLETDEGLKVYALDASRDELRRELEAALGSEPWSLIVGLYAFGPGAEDMELLAHLGAVASHAGGPFLAAAKPELVEAAGSWDALRKSTVAPWIGLALPRVLLRPPYGKGSDPVESFPFEELSPRREHESYLWGSGALACALLIGRAFESRGWDMEPGDELELDDLPSHLYEADGEKCLQASAEAHLSERAAQAILDAGLMPLVSYKNRNAVRVLRFQSISSPAQPLRGPWR
jgi:type VI secretion system protein ImpC